MPKPAGRGAAARPGPRGSCPARAAAGLRRTVPACQTRSGVGGARRGEALQPGGIRPAPAQARRPGLGQGHRMGARGREIGDIFSAESWGGWRGAGRWARTGQGRARAGPACPQNSQSLPGQSWPAAFGDLSSGSRLSGPGRGDPSAETPEPESPTVGVGGAPVAKTLPDLEPVRGRSPGPSWASPG